MKKYLVIAIIFVFCSKGFAKTTDSTTINFNVQKLFEAFVHQKTGGQKVLQYHEVTEFLGITVNKKAVYANLIASPQTCTYFLVQSARPIKGYKYLNDNIIFVSEYDLDGNLLEMYGVNAEGKVMCYFETQNPSVKEVARVENVLGQVELLN